MPKKSVQSKIWASVISKIALAGLVYGLFYIIGDSLHIIPQSLKDFMSFLVGNFQLLAFMFCFTIGAFVFLRILQTRNKSGRSLNQ